MKVPSYEDLTPGIADVDQAAAGLSSLLEARPGRPAGAPQSVPDRTDGCPDLLASCAMHFACMRGPSCDALLPIAREFSPRVMRISDSEVVLDVSGLGCLIGDPPSILRELRRAMREAGLEGTVAIAPTCTAARLLAACGDPATRIETLPVALLQPIEAGLTACATAAMTARDRLRPYDILDKWGIATLADLAALPPDGLASRLGRRGRALQRLARGEDLRPFVPDPDTPRYVERLELEWPIDTLEPLSFVLPRLLDPLAAALERADRGAAAIRLALRLTDRTTHARVLQLPAAMRDPRVLRTLLLLDLESHPPSAAIDVVTIEIDPAPARITQWSLLARALPSAETLSTLTARLSALAGEARVGSPVLLDSHRPDAFVMARYAPDGAGRTPPVPAIPIRRPDPSGPAHLRRCRPPVPIRVSVAQGRPGHIAVSRRGMPAGAIEEAAGPWRSSGEWWTTSHWCRNEWDVALTSGAVCRLYQDRLTERWFLDGIYD